MAASMLVRHRSGAVVEPGRLGCVVGGVLVVVGGRVGAGVVAVFTKGV